MATKNKNGGTSTNNASNDTASNGPESNGKATRKNYFKDRVRIFDTDKEAKAFCDDIVREYIADGNGVKCDAAGKPILTASGEKQYYPPIFAVYTIAEKNKDGETGEPLAFVVGRSEADALAHHIEQSGTYTAFKTFGSERALTKDNASTKLSRVTADMSAKEKEKFLRDMAAKMGVKL